jgi:4'-phosphopantetheinyl transferase
MSATTSTANSNPRMHLANDAVHLWHFPYERAQGRAPLLDVLARYVGRTAEEIRLVAGEHGRPRLADEPAATLDFNWSHCADHAAVALARGLAPGIDIERLDERANALRLAQRYFHPAEIAALAALPAQARSRAFLELWTAKEALLKALGRGLAFGLHRLQVSGGPAPRLLALEGDDPAAWQLHRPSLDGVHVAALAWRGGRRRLIMCGAEADLSAPGNPDQPH